MSPDLQVVFLSVLENRSIEKIGGEAFTPDVRCIFATNADVGEAVANGSFRRDLLGRIPNTIRIPSLRDRRGDIFLLAKHFAREQMTDRCLVTLLRYRWLGNIRELKSNMAIAVARKTSEGKSKFLDLDDFDFPEDILSGVAALDDQACRRKLWTLADEIARGEGYEHGGGLQHRAGEIMGVGDGQASKIYQAYGLAREASGSLSLGPQNVSSSGQRLSLAAVRPSLHRPLPSIRCFLRETCPLVGMAWPLLEAGVCPPIARFQAA